MASHPSDPPPRVPCLRRTPAREWTHEGMFQDAQVVAALCRCDECIRAMMPRTEFYKRRKPNGKS